MDAPTRSQYANKADFDVARKAYQDQIALFDSADEEFEPRQIRITFHADDVRTLHAIEALDVDESGIIGHILSILDMGRVVT